MDVSMHKVKKKLIVCLATSSKELCEKSNSTSASAEFSVIVLEWTHNKDKDIYTAEKIFDYKSPVPQITQILYRP